ncbi:MAG: DUF1614 domain-containing protein [Syntrophobacteraceae bacterium]|nr:DUF1614 domain-containing protein [Syntrophobacteraceae bacterium]
MQYLPIALPFYVFFFFLFAFLIVMIEVKVLSYAYERMGINGRYVLFLLLISLFSTYFNIPLYHLPPEHVVSGARVDFFGMRYIVPLATAWQGPMLAVNVGGALIPTLLCVYLIIKNKLFFRSLPAVALVTLVVHALAYPVKGLGIAEPLFVPPLIACAAGLLFAWRAAPALAYISGTLGTLIGADLMNLDKLQGLGAPIVSIGGAGTFDGIFLTGIVAVLLATVFSRPGQEEGNTQEV